MLFNSLDFAVFLPIVFLLYWFVANKSIFRQNLLVLIASFVFYGWWDWRFLSLLLFSIVTDYFIGLWLHKTEKDSKRKRILWLSILVNLGFLGFFKYYNFFLDNFIQAFSLFGKELQVSSLKIILPVGISFYTFQTLSYTIDIYRKKLEPTRDFIAFAAFVSFFPQLVAGPIERATNLLPQFFKERKFNYALAVDGSRQILWGLFKKMVIADNCAEYANMIFNNHSEYSGSTLALGAVFFAIQIYGDFSGYSDIAIGTARLFGFKLMRNFAYPYFSRDMAEFWRRWHISLSTWFRDYVYIPLGGSRGSKALQIRNTFIIFLVSGFWHGANWTFIVWGALNALYFLPLLLRQRNRVHLEIVAENSLLPNLREAWQMLRTFALAVFAWIFFRAESLTHAWEYIQNMFIGFSQKSAYWESLNFVRYHTGKMLFVLLAFFIFMEWKGRREAFALENMSWLKNKGVRYAFYYLIILLIFWYGGKEQEFIYFQF